MGIYAGNVKEEQENNQHYVFFFFLQKLYKKDCFVKYIKNCFLVNLLIWEQPSDNHTEYSFLFLNWYIKYICWENHPSYQVFLKAFVTSTLKLKISEHWWNAIIGLNPVSIMNVWIHIKLKYLFRWSQNSSVCSCPLSRASSGRQPMVYEAWTNGIGIFLFYLVLLYFKQINVSFYNTAEL